MRLQVMETQEARDTKRLLAAYEQKEADAKAGGDALHAETDPELQENIKYYNKS